MTDSSSKIRYFFRIFEVIKKYAPKILFSIKKNHRDFENSLWKSDFGTFLQTDGLTVQWLSLSMLIFGQRLLFFSQLVIEKVSICYDIL